MAAKEKSTFSQFFKEDAELVQDIIYGQNGQEISASVGTVNKPVVPQYPKITTASEGEIIEYWKKLRSFFRNDLNKDGIPEDLKPVHMAPLYEKIIIGTDFPVWIADANYDGLGEYCLSLKELLESRLPVLGHEETDGKIVKDNIDRVVHIANKLLFNHREQDFRQIIDEALEELRNQLDISGSDLETFENDIQKLSDHLPDNGVLIPYSSHTVFDIMEAAMFASHDARRKQLKEEISQLKNKLYDLLRADEEKNPRKQKATDMQNSLDFAEGMVNFNELSSILPESGSVSIEEDRVKRIIKVIQDFENAEPILDQQAFMAIGEYLEKRKNIAWNNLFPNIETQIYTKGTGSKTITKLFKKHIKAWTNLFIAMRTGQLELENSYQADVHDDYFSHFTWRNLSIEELDNCPYFMLVADDIELFESEFNKLSVTLDKNIPIKIVAVKSDNSRTEDEIVDLHTQAELGSVMLSHKNIYVAQCTSITPKELFNVFQEGLTAFAPAVFNILNVDAETHDNPYLWTSASIESRDFPGFIYAGMLGTPWGRRFTVDNNPQPQLSWPNHEVEYENKDGDKEMLEAAFTFADLAILNPSYHYHFMDIEPQYWTDNLITLDQYIDNTREENIGKLPFIWTMDSQSILHKTCVSWQVALAAQERLDFWRFLQENSGIHNYHVAIAKEKTTAELEKKHEEAMLVLREAHKKELEEVRKEEAGKVMDNLTSVLLNLDSSTLDLAGSSAAPASTSEDTAPAEPVAKQEESQPAAEEEEMLSQDPYIDTPMCTSCNECIEKNKEMFKYNGDKMAYIADASKGTFRQLVEAAEACPVNIIHPGTPLNKNEDGLAELIERAKEFN